MLRSSVSIADIAKAAGVSHSTVSRALRDSPLISPDVRRRIHALATEMGYTPNALAQSLQTRRSHTLGLVVTSIADPFFTDVVKGVEEIARPARFSVFLSASYNDPDQEMAVIETFHRRQVHQPGKAGEASTTVDATRRWSGRCAGLRTATSHPSVPHTGGVPGADGRVARRLSPARR